MIRPDREPWLAATFSWLYPGLGHLYAGMRRRGVCLLIMALVLQVLLIDSAISIRVPLWTFLLVGGVGNLILPIWAARDAFGNTRAWNTGNFERERIAGKDPWLAVFLSALQPGLGHLYLRRWFIGAFLILASTSLFVVAHVRLPASMEKVRWLAFVAASLLSVLVLAHAYVAGLSRRGGWKTRPVTLAVLLLATYCVTDLLRPLAIGYFFMSHSICIGRSMTPTLRNGTHVILDRFTYRRRDPAVGEIVMFVQPTSAYSHNRLHAVKRIVAEGGETVQVLDYRVWVNGKEREPLIRVPRGPDVVSDAGDNPYEAYGVREPYRVPEGCYFVLGDNRPNSQDSRCYGAVPGKGIIGRIVKSISLPAHRGPSK